MADSAGDNGSSGGNATSPYTPFVTLILAYVVIGFVLVVLSTWHESAVLIQGFILSLMLILVLSATGIINKDLSAAFGAINGLATRHKIGGS